MNKTSAAFVFTSAMLLASLTSYAQDFGSVPDEKVPDISAVFTIDGESDDKAKKINGQTVTASKSDQSALLVKDGVSGSASKSTFNKSSGDSSNEGQSNFYGLNGAVVAQGNSSLTLSDVKVNTDADGANAIFATGKNTKVTANNITIRTSKNSSRGLDATYGGSIYAKNVDIATKGAHCAAFATDRGEGNVSVYKGKASTSGEGSPVIYSTGNISVENLTGSAENSEIAVIEGKNSISIKNSKLTSCGSQGIMLYQSMSGDANIGTSSFTSSSSSLTYKGSGPFMYVTNTQAVVNLTNNKLNFDSGILLQVSGNNSERGWGKKGANGGTLTFNAEKQNLEGKIICDEISFLDLNLGAKSSFKGEINSACAGIVNLNLNKKAKVILTGTSYVNNFSDGNTSYSNITSNGYTLYYNKNASANAYLAGKTINLKDGGKLCAYNGKSDAAIKSLKEKLSSGNDEKGKGGPGPKGNGGPGQMGNGGPGPKGNGGPGQMPKMELSKLTGTINSTGSGETLKVLLVCSDGNSYLLKEMTPPKAGKNEGGSGNPPAGMGNPPMGNPPDGMGGGSGPEQMGKGGPGPKGSRALSLEELAKLNGKTVTLEGLIENKDFTVFKIEN